MMSLGIHDIEAFPFPSPPPPLAVSHAVSLLKSLGAVSTHLSSRDENAAGGDFVGNEHPRTFHTGVNREMLAWWTLQILTTEYESS